MSQASASYSVRYRFSQSFKFPARAAYQWCTDFAPDDWTRMGEEGTRKIKPINEDALILIDTVIKTDGNRRRPVIKQRLVRLDPDRMAWTNTHLTGPNKHSQFWYQIVAEDEKKSRLDFAGLQVNYGKKRPSAGTIKEMAADLEATDSRAWRLLAKEMHKDLLSKSK